LWLTSLIVFDLVRQGFSDDEELIKSKRLTKKQTIRILHEAETGLSVAGICRGHNCSEQSFYSCKAKFGGVEVLKAKRLRELERKNAEIERMVAEQAPNIRMLKDVNSRKW